MELNERITKEMSSELLEHVNKQVIPQYEKNDKGHGLPHIKTVIQRSFELLNDLKLDLDHEMVFVIAVYHDIGRVIDDKMHEKISSKIFLEDEFMKKYYSEEKRKIISEAIEDHRASIKYEPRNEYGKLVSSADRNSDVLAPLVRTYLYALKHNPEISLEENSIRAYEHLKDKFGEEKGYANKVWFDNGKYAKYLQELREMLNNYDEFRKKWLEANKINEFEYYLKKVDKDIIKYVETNIFPQYEKNDKAHGLVHIKTVILRSFELLENLKMNLNHNYIYTIAAYHDLGKHIDHKTHEKIAAKKFLNDEFMKKYYSEEERKLISEAIEDHRSSFEDLPRSEYGKLISSADRNTSIEIVFKRSYEVGKWRNPTQTVGDFLDFTFERLVKRYSIENPENMFLNDLKYEKFIKDMRELLKDEEKFKNRYCSVNKIDINKQEKMLKTE